MKNSRKIREKFEKYSRKNIKISYTRNGISADKYESWSVTAEDFEKGGSGMGDLFGWAIDVGDFNNDGIDDAIIGSPCKNHKK